MTWNRLVLAASVLAAGLVAAWPFRHPKPPPAAVVAAPGGPDQLPLRSSDVRLEVSPLAETSPAASGLEQLSLKSRKAKKDELLPHELPVAPALETLASPPPLSQMYQSLLEPSGSEPRPPSPEYQTYEPRESAAVRAFKVSATTSAAVSRRPEDFRPVLREHRIVDGDSLERLAQRYLGDASRAEEIFELNRDRLRDPNILPVGKRLRIPQRHEQTLTPVARTE